MTERLIMLDLYWLTFFFEERKGCPNRSDDNSQSHNYSLTTLYYKNQLRCKQTLQKKSKPKKNLFS